MSLSEKLLHTLRVWGQLPASELLNRLGVSRATLMRAVRQLGPQIVSGGQARRSAYAARRAVRGRSDVFPLYRIDETGQAHEAAMLAPLHPGGCLVQWREPCPWPLDPLMADGWFTGLPFVMDDLRPQGFLGRHFAHAHASLLQVPMDPAQWSDDDVLHALSLLGIDLPGNYLLGEAALRTWLDIDPAQALPVTKETWAQAYPRLAEQALAQGDPGSSAGGEFPKFLALRAHKGEVRHVLVKFTGDDDSPATRRWSDLLVCEHLAGRALREHLGMATVNTRLLQAAGRTFLEVERFDRHGLRGRSAVCTWTALNAGHLGLPAPSWVAGAQALHARGWISAGTQQDIARLWQFGRLIANSDMHDGNLAFRPGLQLAPVYDMLPMRYAPPRAAEVTMPAFVPPLPMPAEREAWQAALPAARAFWSAAAEDERISGEFRRACADHVRALERLAT